MKGSGRARCARPPLPAAATLAALALGVTLPGCGRHDAGPTAPSSPTPPAARFDYAGITHVSWWHDEYGYPSATDSRRALAATGAGWAGVLTTWYMDSRTASSIRPHASRSNSDGVVRRAIDELHALGLRVMLKPHVDVEDGTWRAQVEPADPAAWFESYAAMLEHYADLAAGTRTEMLVVGTELASMSGSRHAGAWSSLISRVRARYPGLLTYAANGVEPGDEFTSVAFWPQLDLLGLDVYTPLTDKANPTRGELQAGWRRNRYGHDMLAAFSNWQRAHGKPVVFTEIGYRSGDGANRAPWDWGATMSPDPVEQADCYAAMYEVWSRESAWMKGSFWWAWDVQAPVAGDTGYNPRGKPAEDVLRQWQR